MAKTKDGEEITAHACCDKTVDLLTRAIFLHPIMKSRLGNELSMNENFTDAPVQKAFRELMDVEADIRSSVKKIVQSGISWNMG